MLNTTLQKTADGIVKSVLNEYKMSAKSSPLTYVRLARKLHASGICPARALEIVNTGFPNEARAFLAAQERGEKLPILFPKTGPSYAERRALALKRGGIIG